jgi:hypothetical protein
MTSTSTSSLTQPKEDRQSLTKLQNMLLDYLTFIPKEIIFLLVDYLRLYVHRFQMINVLIERVTIAIALWKGIHPWNPMMKQSILFKITRTCNENNLKMWEIGISTAEKQRLLFIEPWCTAVQFSLDYQSAIMQCYTDQEDASQSPFTHLNHLLETFTIEMTLIGKQLSYYFKDRENKRRLIVTYVIAHVLNHDWFPYIQIPQNFQIEILDE